MSRAASHHTIRSSSGTSRGKGRVASRHPVLPLKGDVPKELQGRLSWWERFMDRSALGGMLASLFVHAILILAMALIIIRPPDIEEMLTLIWKQDGKAVAEIEMVVEVEPSDDQQVRQEVIRKSLPVNLTRFEESAQKLAPNILDPAEANSSSLHLISNLDINTDFGGRDEAAREKLLKIFGGNAQSESAVRNALKWLAQRQAADGSWSFDHRRKSDKHANHQAGSLQNCKTGATGMALMVFLGAGETQKQGQYMDCVDRALKFLIRNAARVPEGYDLRGRYGPKNSQISNGTHVMYAHALATIALCEAYAMTEDRRLRTVAQGAIEFIFKARNREQGGWRYRPLEPGDLSVSGWMIMALQSGKTAGLRVSDIAFKSSRQFLDTTQSARGAKYSYTSRGGPSPVTTSIGLLCRMYLGWERKSPALQSGIFYLSELGPSPDNIYHNYYATQVMHHAGGESWTKWNLVMRDFLINTQVTRGPEKGSWDVTDPHGYSGGRFYQTCLSAMTLEVYYRHLPLYQMRAIGK